MSSENSSFEKVYRALFETAECKNLVQAICKALDEISLKGVDWRLEDDEKDRAVVSPRFLMNCGDKELVYSSSQNNISVSAVVEYSAIDSVVNANEGKVPTYNCSWKVVSQGRSYGPRGSQQSFRSWVQDKITETCKDQFERAKIRIARLITSHENTEEFAKSRQDALADYCIKEVSKVMLRFSQLPKEVLKAGLDDFVCHEIMDT